MLINGMNYLLPSLAFKELKVFEICVHSAQPYKCARM